MIVFSAYAQEYGFHTYPQEELPDIGTIGHIFQDSRGILWFSGTRGAAYYDGREFYRFSVSNGLRSNYIYRITESPEGQIWMCTRKGISIYDPISGELTTHSFRPEETLRDVIFWEDDYIIATENIPSWIRSKGHFNIVLIDTMVFREAYPVVNDLLYDRENNLLWVATEYYGVFSVDINSYLKNWEMKEPQKQEEYYRLGRVEFNRKYPDMFYDLNTYVIDDSVKRHEIFTKSVRRYDYREKYGTWYITSLSQDVDGKIWAVAKNGLFKLVGNRFQLQYDLMQMVDGFDGFSIDAEGNKYISGRNSGIIIFKNNGKIHFSQNNGLKTNSVTAWLKDRQGIFWFALEDGSMQKLTSTVPRIFAEKEYPYLKNVSFTLKMEDGSYLLGCPDGIGHYNSGKMVPYFFQPSKTDPLCGLALDKKNNLIITTAHNIYQIQENSVRILAKDLATMERDVIFVLDYKGELWFVRGGRVYSWDGEKLKVHQGLDDDIIISTFLYSAPDSCLFIGTWHGLYRIKHNIAWFYIISEIGFNSNIWSNNSSFEPKRGFPLGLMTDHVVLCGDVGPDSAYWFGTFTGGLIRMKGDSLRAYDNRDGLRSKYYGSVYKDTAGTLYFSGDEGVCQVSAEGIKTLKFSITQHPEFNNMVVDEAGRKLFATSRGLLILNENEGTEFLFDREFGLNESKITRIIKTSDNEFLLIQPHSIALFNSKDFFGDKTGNLPIFLTGIWDDKNRYPVDTTVTFKPGKRDVRFNFALPDFRNESGNRFSWKLEGLESSFTPSTKKQEAYYERLPAGEYKFHVRAIDNMGLVREGIDPITIEVPPYFYETVLFKICCVIIILLLAYLILRWRVRSINDANIRLEKKVNLRTTELVKEKDKVEQAYSAQQESEARFRRLSESTLEGVAIHDKGKILDANQALANIFGYNLSEIIGKNAQELAAPEYRELLMKNIMSGYEEPYEAIGVKKDGSTFIGEIIGKAIPYQGKIVRVSVIRDITERKRVENELKQYATTQEILLQEVNHRVKNNLSAIISLLHKEEDRAKAKGNIAQLPVLQDLEARIHGLSIVHRMLSDVVWQPLELNQLCEKIINAGWQSLFPSKTMKIVVSPSNVKVNSDQAHHLTLIINELVTNTLKHAGSEKKDLKVNVKIQKKGNNVLLRFKDNGPGYPEAMLKGDLSRTNVGYDLIMGIVRRNLQGDVLLKNDNGAECSITFNHASTLKD